MEEQQRRPIEPRVPCGFCVPVHDVVGELDHRLTDVVRREDRGAGIAACRLERVPLNGHRKDDRQHRKIGIAAEAEQSHHRDRRRRDHQADDFHAQPRVPPADDVKGVRRAVNEKEQHHEADAFEVARAGAENQLDEVARLRVRHDVEVIEDSIARHKTADHADGVVQRFLFSDAFHFSYPACKAGQSVGTALFW